MRRPCTFCEAAGRPERSTATNSARSWSPIDLDAVRLARANLRKLVKQHPELAGPPGAVNRTGWEETLTEIEMAENDEQIVVRLPKALVERVDAHVARLKKDQPGLRVTRSDGVRLLLTAALGGAGPKSRR